MQLAGENFRKVYFNGRKRAKSVYMGRRNFELGKS